MQYLIVVYDIWKNVEIGFDAKTGDYHFVSFSEGQIRRRTKLEILEDHK